MCRLSADTGLPEATCLVSHSQGSVSDFADNGFCVQSNKSMQELACTMEWKTASPNSSLWKADLFEQPSKKAGLEKGSERYVRSRPALRPLGGSLVILTPFSRMEMGKMGEG